MGGDIIPMLVDRDAGRGLRLQAQRRAGLDCRPTATTGVTSGRLASYHEAHLDLVSVEPMFNLYNSQWPIFTSHPQLPGAKFVEYADGRGRHRLRRLDRLRRDRDGPR